MSWFNKKSNGVLVCGACAVVMDEKRGGTASEGKLAKAVKRIFA